jgi:hypothetical protein
VKWSQTVISAAHTQAQDLAVRASLALREGRRREATELYAKAAALEQQALREVPTSKPRTWGILAVSAASLLYKARKHAEVEIFLHSLLARSAIAPFARRQLKELLEVVLDEQSLPAGFNYSGEEIIFSLRGQAIGYGTAPFELVLQKGTELKSFVTRAAELRGGFEFRRSGSPVNPVSDFVQARATQPTSGSYRFAIRLVEPAQADFFEPPRLRAADVSDTLFDFAKLASSGEPRARDELRRLVPDENYRRAMLRLLRNVLPADGGISEVELARVVPTKTSEDPQFERIHLSRVTRSNIASLLEAEQPSISDETREFTGILRALHLDKGWLEITTSDGPQRCETDRDVLDDVVGPMVNRNVRVRAKTLLRRGKPRYHVLDIEADDD